MSRSTHVLTYSPKGRLTYLRILLVFAETLPTPSVVFIPLQGDDTTHIVKVVASSLSSDHGAWWFSFASACPFRVQPIV